MKVLFDTNVILDLLLEREPFADAAAELASLADDGSVEGYLCATSVTTIHYLASRALDRKQAVALLEDLLDIFEVAPVTPEVLMSALHLEFGDYEDAVLHEAAVGSGVDAIVTRDRAGFKRSALPVFSPQEALAALKTLS